MNTNFGQYLIDAGTILQMFFKATWAQQVGGFLTTLGIAMESGQGSVGPVRLGNESLTVTITPWTA